LFSAFFGTNRQSCRAGDLLPFVARFTKLFYLPGGARAPTGNRPPRLTLAPRPSRTSVSFLFDGAFDEHRA